MLDIANDIKSLSHFKRNTAEIMDHLKETGSPVVLTVNGEARIVVQNAQAYQRVLELAEKSEMMDFLEASRKDMEADRTIPAREFLESLGRKRKKAKKA